MRERNVLGVQMVRDAFTKCSAEDFDQLVNKAKSGDFTQMLEDMSGTKLPDVEYVQLIQILTSAQAAIRNYKSED